VIQLALTIVFKIKHANKTPRSFSVEKVSKK